jgi:hypothetical protein
MVARQVGQLGLDDVPYEDDLAVGLEHLSERPQVLGRQAKRLDDSSMLFVDSHWLGASDARTRSTDRIAADPSPGTVTTSVRVPGSSPIDVLSPNGTRTRYRRSRPTSTATGRRSLSWSRRTLL